VEFVQYSSVAMSKKWVIVRFPLNSSGKKENDRSDAQHFND